MKAPKVLKVDNRKYIYIKKYPNFYLYQQSKGMFYECFDDVDIIQVQLGLYDHKKWYN